MKIISNVEELRSVLLSVFNKYDSIGLLTHKNPDGDGLSTCLVLQEILKDMDKQVKIILEEEALDSLDFLKAKEKTIIYNEQLAYPLVIIVDCHSRRRLGICAPLLDKAEMIIAIDHHEDNGANDVDYLYNNPYIVSAGAIIYQALKEEIIALSNNIREESAQAIYVTILNDTNNFTNSNTNAKVFELAAELTRLGIKPYEITRIFMLSKPANYYRFIGQALSTIETHIAGKVLFFHSTLKMLDDNGLHSDATSKVTNWVKKPIGVEVVVYFREIGENKYRLSLRSETIDVNLIAHKYNGGGHMNAAGCEITNNLEDIKATILHDIENQLVFD
ncbi:MAG: DHH family phosphoesterase [Candidatus Cloacimonetes bacterium]|nr:DHH family phosphoesterase [Candidatus Cloacimonadota bacterium]